MTCNKKNKVLENQGVTPEKVMEKIEELVGINEENRNNTGISIGFTPRTKRIIENAYVEARNTNSEYIGTEHLLLGIMHEGDSVAVRIMMELNVDPKKLYDETLKIINETSGSADGKEISRNVSNSFNQTPTLNQYGTDLTKKAQEGKLDPVIGRTSQIE